MKKTNSIVSIIIPIYKVEKYVRDTICSLKNQTTHDFEIILVDDGSPDQSAAVAVKELENSNIPFSLITQYNSGMGIARNSGVQVANGDWILFLDSDDVLQPFAIEKLIALTQQLPDVDAIFSDFQRTLDTDIFALAEHNDSFDVLNHNDLINIFLKRSRNMLVPGTLYNKAFLLKNGLFHRGIRWSEDQCFQWEVLNKINKAVYLNCVLYNYRTRPGSIMDATKVDVMMTAYAVFKDIAAQMNDEITRRFIVPRWVLGCLHVVAKRHDRDGWRYIWDNMSGDSCMKTLRTFPDKKVKIIAFVGWISEKMLYKILG